MREIYIGLAIAAGSIFLVWVFSSAISNLVRKIFREEFEPIKVKIEMLVTKTECGQNHKIEAIERESHRKDTERHESDIDGINKRLNAAGI